MSFEIDPVRYGQLWEKVDSLTAKVDKLEVGMEELLALANKGRGGFWMGMTIVSSISAFIVYMSSTILYGPVHPQISVVPYNVSLIQSTSSTNFSIFLSCSWK